MKTSICSTFKENLLLYCRKFSSFFISVTIKHILTARSASQETSLVIEIINFVTEPLVFQNRLLKELVPSQIFVSFTNHLITSSLIFLIVLNLGPIFQY